MKRNDARGERAASAELDRCAKRGGFVGILLYTNLAGVWCDEPRFRWLYARAEELDLPIPLHASRSLRLPAKDQDLVLRDNARRLFRL